MRSISLKYATDGSPVRCRTTQKHTHEPRSKLKKPVSLPGKEEGGKNLWRRGRLRGCEEAMLSNAIHQFTVIISIFKNSQRNSIVLTQ